MGEGGDSIFVVSPTEDWLSRQRITPASELGERLGNGRIEETRPALDLCHQ